MKKFILSLIVIFTGAYTFYNEDLQTNSGEPNLLVTGAPGESTCNQSSCHNTYILNEGPAVVTLNYNGDDTYDGEVIYNITLSADADTMKRFGFELIAIDENNVGQGNFINSDPNISIRNFNNKQYVSHKNIPLQNAPSFSLQWQAPSEDVGNITFYYAFNAANGDGGIFNDLIYSGSLSIEPLFVGIEEIVSTDQLLYSNPLAHRIDVVSPQIQLISLYNIEGKLIAESDTSIDTQQLNSGIYVLSIVSQGKLQSMKLVK